MVSSDFISGIIKENSEELRAEQLFWWGILRKVTKKLISWLKKQFWKCSLGRVIIYNNNSWVIRTCSVP
jgi:hypothetical protein